MKNGILFAFGLLFTGLSVVFLDQDFAQYLDQWKFEEFRLQARSITNIALGEYWFGLSLVVYVVSRWVIPRLSLGRWSRDSVPQVSLRGQLWAIYFFTALLGSGLLLQAIKHVVGRERPHLTPQHDPLIFKPFTTDWNFHSFPSGHSQVLFASAAALILIFPRARWLIFLLAASLSMTRAVILQHFISDVFGGAMVGYFGALWMFSILSHKWPWSSRASAKNRKDGNSSSARERGISPLA